MKKFLKNNYFALIILLFLTWRLMLFVLAYAGPAIIKEWGNRFPYVEEQLISTKLPYWIWSWGNFDGVHYLNIAKNSYSHYYTQAFFPLYPLVVRLAAKICFSNYLLAAILVSNLSFLLSLFVFRKLLFLDYPDHKLFFWIVIFLLAFPTSFYFGGVYTESLFLLFILMTLYLARQKKWFTASFFGMLASATRLIGIFIFFAFLVEYFLENKKPKKTIKSLFVLMLSPFGLIAYMVYLYFKFQDPLLFWHVQPGFGAQRAGSGLNLPFQVIVRYFKIFLTVDYHQLVFWNAAFELVSFVLAALLLIKGHLKKIRLSYLIFGWLSLITPTLTGTFSSMPRYILVIFPLFIVLGLSKNDLIKILWLFFSLIMLIIAVLFFTRGYWVA